MTPHLPVSWIGLIAICAIAAFIVAQPIGVIWHVLEDHLAEHAHVVHTEPPDAGDHGSDHGHVWMTPAVAVMVPQLSRPATRASVSAPEDLTHRSPAPLPPFSPPRA